MAQPSLLANRLKISTITRRISIAFSLKEEGAMTSPKRWRMAVTAASWFVCANVNAVGVNVPARLYDLKAGITEYDSWPDPLPDLLKRRLNGVDFSKLSSALQRALVWDTGFVLSADESEFIPILVGSGRSMLDVFLSRETVAEKCALQENCNTLVGIIYARANCSASAMSSQIRCAVSATTTVTQVSRTVWSSHEDISTNSTFRVYRYEDPESSSSSSSTSTTLFTIAESTSETIKDSSCLGEATFITPCIQISSSESEWTSPQQDPLVDLWLADEVKSSSDIWQILALVFMALFGLCILGLVPTVICCLRKQRQDHASTAASGVQQVSGDTSNTSSRPSGRTSVGLSTGSIPRNSGNEIDRYNGDLCRRSHALTAFCNDQAMMMKRIEYSSIRFRTLVAKGAFGEVWRGELEGRGVAIKRLLNGKRDDIHAIEVFAKEIRLACVLEHPNIVRYIGVSWRSLAELSMVSEFMPAGDLTNLLRAQESQQLTWRRDKLPLSIAIANALVYLHSLAPVIIHRDLKSRNVLLTEKLTAKLSDFGLSREFQFDQTMTGGVGTLLWTAPEVLRGEKYSEKADIYSFGIVLSELDTCLPPFARAYNGGVRQMSNMEALPLLRNGTLTPSFDQDCPPPLLLLALSCVDNDPNNRPNAMQVVYTLRSKVRDAL